MKKIYSNIIKHENYSENEIGLNYNLAGITPWVLKASWFRDYPCSRKTTNEIVTYLDAVWDKTTTMHCG